MDIYFISFNFKVFACLYLDVLKDFIGVLLIFFSCKVLRDYKGDNYGEKNLSFALEACSDLSYNGLKFTKVLVNTGIAS